MIDKLANNMALPSIRQCKEIFLIPEYLVINGIFPLIIVNKPYINMIIPKTITYITSIYHNIFYFNYSGFIKFVQLKIGY